MKFDQTFRENYKPPQCQIGLIRYNIKYTFIIYLLNIIIVDSFVYTFGQTLILLTLEKTYTPCF